MDYVTISKKTYMKKVHLQGGICDEKQWGINMKIEEKLRKISGNIDCSSIIGDNPPVGLSSIQIQPCPSRLMKLKTRHGLFGD